ncbi:MAG: hypothetical protein GYA02_01760 [Clostridiaceae bacterium]|nr:hypothetical protein [Clostridiaceae bacterium]
MRKNKKIFKIVSICTALLIIMLSSRAEVISSSNGKNAAYNTIAMNANINEDYKKIAQNTKFTLLCNLKTGTIIVENRQTGYLWRSIIDNLDDYGLENLSTYWSNYISSLFSISYTDLKKNNGSEEKVLSAADASIDSINNIDNGISIEYNFGRLGINITIEISLQEDGMTVFIPAGKIKENSNFGIVTVELMPFLGAVADDIDGYIFFPDGCGAIMKYGNTIERPKFTDPYESFVFSPEKVDISENIRMGKEQKYNAMLPIYGIKNSENAFLAIATKGAEETAIQVSPYGYLINLNRAGFKLYYRHFYEINLSNINIHGRDVAKNLKGQRANKEIILQDHEVQFIFLDGNDANYSGMANVYRNHLAKNSGLKKVIKNGSNIPMAINLFMGVKEKRMLFDKYVSMTTFQQAIIITERLKDRGIDNLQVNLKGWAKGGYGIFPDSWPPDNRLGGVPEMTKLLEYMDINNINLFLQANFIDAVSESYNFSKRNDVIIQSNDLPATDSGQERFIINPSSCFNRIEELINKISTKTRCGSGIGLTLENLGRALYPDYNKNNPSSRAQTLKTWENIFHLVEKSKMSIGVEGGNAYVLKYADYLFDIQVKSSGYYIVDEAIPFFQMVVHGMVPYTSEPGNLAYDLNKQKLQWIEYGCVPLFELTYDSTTKLKDTNYNILFNSRYERWINTIEDIYKEFNENLKDIWDAQMIGHEKIDQDLVKISYSNGTVIYINYGFNDIYYEGFNIEGQNYIVTHRSRGEVFR